MMQKYDSDFSPTLDIHLMNEVALHRGRSPHMTTIDAYVDGRHLTQAIVSAKMESEEIIKCCSPTNLPFSLTA